MCTAATYQTKDFYFGRTLDYEFSYGDEVTVTPRNYPFTFRHIGLCAQHYAIVGMAHVAEQPTEFVPKDAATADYPLYYDAMNEKGLCMAGLNFVGNAAYQEIEESRENVAQFEFIPYILGKCADVGEARQALARMNLVGTTFNDVFPAAQLHWMIADKTECITVESVADGLKVYENPVGVMTNNPPFPYQMFNLNNYLHLSVENRENTFSDALVLNQYSRGMGGMGLPGDLSSQSRFVRVAFVKMNSLSGDSEEESVSQFFHILGSVDQQRGCCKLGEDKYEITLYTSCCNTERGIYYYNTYDNHQISAVDLHRENLDSEKLIAYAPVKDEQIRMQN